MSFFSPKMSAEGRAASRLRLSYDALGPLVGLCDALVIVAFCLIGSAGYQLLSNDQINTVSSDLAVGLVASVAYARSVSMDGLYLGRE